MDWLVFPAPSVCPVLAAPFIGSFLGVIVTRSESPRSILWGRSACPDCSHRLEPRDLVPILSWLVSGGRCRHCGQSVSSFYPAIELAALAVAAWSTAVASGWLIIASSLLGWLLLALALIDLRSFLLPDFLTLPLLGSGLLVAQALDSSTTLPHVLGAAIGFLAIVTIRQVYWMLRGREGIGLGDAKLMAAAGAWVSWEGLPSVLLVATLGALTSTLLQHYRKATIRATDRVAFGAFLCVGIWLVWLYGPLV
jgi:leader peptidase (prepilin peptidase) / N-methyltransferase